MAEDTRNAKLNLSVETKNSDKAAKDIQGIGKVAKQLDRDLQGIGKSNALAESFREANKELDKLTADIRKDLNGALDDAAKTAGDIKPGSSGGGNAPAAAKFRGAASLVGGGEIVGLIDDFQDLGEGLMQLKDIAPQAAEGFSKMASSIGLSTPVAAGLTIALIAVGAAFAAASAEANKQADVIGSTLDKRRELDKAEREGLTSTDALARIEELNAARIDEADQLADTLAAYDELKPATQSLQDAWKLLSPQEDELANQAGKSQKAIADLDAEIAGLQGRVEDGSLAANDAKAAEQGLAQVRETETPKSIDTAVNAERERAREMEKSARVQERAQQEAQRAQETAAREAQQQAEKAAAAQQKYVDGIKNANTTFKQATADINTKRRTGETDIRISQGRDLDDIELKNNRDLTKLISEDWRSARDEAIQNANEIDDIRREGRKSELEAIREGDFKQLFLAREALKERLQEEVRTDDREGQMRKLHLSDAKDDLKTALSDETSIRRTASQRAMEDLKLSTSRELATAATAKQRSLEMNANNHRAELAQLGQFLQARNQMLTQANQQVLAGMGGRSGGSSAGMNSVGQSIQRQMNSAILATFQR